MDLDDRKTIQTAEGLDLDLTLAGLGSRMIAATVDVIVVGVLVFAVAFGASQLPLGDSGILVQALATIGLSAIVLGYFVGFEGWNEGRTLGKKMVGIRVVTTNGDSIGFLAAFLRNLLRVVDFLPLMFIVGAASILLTRLNQRIGDIAANTLVVRDRLPHLDRAEIDHLDWSDAEPWDVARVTSDDVDVIRRFATRRRSIPSDRTAQIASHLATKIRPKVTGVGTDALSDEAFLLRVLAQKLR